MTTLFQTKIINSYIIKLFLSFCLLAFSYISPILAQKNSVNSSNYLLIINSYTEAAPWSFRMISAITEYAQNSPQLALYTEHMNMLMMDTDSTLNEFRQTVLEKYKQHSPTYVDITRKLQHDITGRLQKDVGKYSDYTMC